MNYRDLGPGHDEDYEPDALTPTSQPASGEDDAEHDPPFRFEVVDESRTPKGWAGPAAIAALLAIAVGAGWSMTHRGTDHEQQTAASSSAAATSTSTSPPATTSTSTSQAAPSTTPAGAAPQEAALTFLRVWGQRTITAGEWEQQIKPLCDERGWFLMQGTDPQNVPEFKVEGAPLGTPRGGAATASARRISTSSSRRPASGR